MTRYKMIIEYDGQPYIGWQQQPNKISVQSTIEQAFSNFVKQKVQVHAAGRTDTGVHALGQVAHFDIETDKDCFEIHNALNYFLQSQKIAILSLEKMSDNFHARFDAIKRTYRYRIINRFAPPIIDHHRAWHVRFPLNFKDMEESASYLKGTHDFTSFQGSHCQSPSPIKTIEKSYFEKHQDELTYIIESKSFLHHQVRNIIGTLVQIGCGKIKDISHILKQKDRTKAGVTAPPYGLYLDKIKYEK